MKPFRACTVVLVSFLIAWSLVPRSAHGGGQIPGDCNQDGTADLSDGICVLGHLILGDPALLPCGDGSPGDDANVTLMDWQTDDLVDLTDGIALLTWVILGGAEHTLGLDCFEIADCPTVCDITAPSIVITGVANGDCVNTDIIPIVDISDDAPDPSQDQVTLNGAPFVSGTTVTDDGVLYARGVRDGSCREHVKRVDPVHS